MESAFGISVQGTTGHHGAKAKGCQRHCFMCVVLHNMLWTHQGGTDSASTPANYAAALQNEAVYVLNVKYRNLLREAKLQRELQKDYFSHVGALSGQEDKI